MHYSWCLACCSPSAQASLININHQAAASAATQNRKAALPPRLSPRHPYGGRNSCRGWHMIVNTRLCLYDHASQQPLTINTLLHVSRLPPTHEYHPNGQQVLPYSPQIQVTSNNRQRQTFNSFSAAGRGQSSESSQLCLQGYACPAARAPGPRGKA